MELGDVWNKADDDKFDKVMTKKQEKSVVADSEKEGDNNSLLKSAIDNDHFLPNQPMPLPVVSRETPSSLSDISKANTFLPPESFSDSADEKDIPKSPNTFMCDNAIDQPRSSRQSRTKSGVIKRLDYKNFKRAGEAMSVLQSHDVFYAKRIPQSHTHMIRVLSALANGDNLGLSHYSKTQNYREARNSPHWLSWKAAMDLEIQSLLENKT